MAYSALDISKYVVTKCVNDEIPISNLQLQKILYYIQKKYLRDGDVAFFDSIQAWQFGPVVPEAYYYFCGNGANPITSIFDKTLDEGDKKKIDAIVEAKRQLDPWDMVEETHKPSGAWAKIYRGGLGNKETIPPELIVECG